MKVPLTLDKKNTYPRLGRPLMSIKCHRSVTVTVDTCIFYDKAEMREGNTDFDKIIECTKSGVFRLFFTANTDLEDASGMATKVAIRLLREGVLSEDPNCGTRRDYMPGGAGTHYVNESTLREMFRTIWPEANWLGRSYSNKERDILGLLAHKKNGRDVYLTRDREFLDRARVLEERFKIAVMHPKDLLLRYQS